MTKYFVRLNRDVETEVGHLVVMSMDGSKTPIAAPTTFVQRAGECKFSTAKSAKAFVKAQRDAHGIDVCSDVYA
jgi:hypothetical protein